MRGSNPDPGTAAALLRYEADDPEEDFAREAASLLDWTPEVARERVQAVLAHYHEKLAPYPEGLERDAFGLIVHITQPLRLPHMTTRLDPVLATLREAGGLETLLDYGGGGGKDSIIYARAGYRVTYSDLLDALTPYVARRFEIRGLSAEVLDVRDLGERRYDVIHSADVLEHVYDLEFVLADMVARLEPGSHLICYPAFFNSWDGDHVEKNCGYSPYFIPMVRRIGLDFVGDRPQPASWRHRALLRLGLGQNRMPMLHLVRRRPGGGTVEEEREEIRNELYRLSRGKSLRMSLLALFLLPPLALVAMLIPPGAKRRTGWRAVGLMASHVIDNLAIWRLSRHRLKEAREAAQRGR